MNQPWQPKCEHCGTYLKVDPMTKMVYCPEPSCGWEPDDEAERPDEREDLTRGWPNAGGCF